MSKDIANKKNHLCVKKKRKHIYTNEITTTKAKVIDIQTAGYQTNLYISTISLTFNKSLAYTSP